MTEIETYKVLKRANKGLFVKQIVELGNLKRGQVYCDLKELWYYDFVRRDKIKGVDGKFRAKYFHLGTIKEVEKKYTL